MISFYVNMVFNLLLHFKLLSLRECAYVCWEAGHAHHRVWEGSEVLATVRLPFHHQATQRELRCSGADVTSPPSHLADLKTFFVKCTACSWRMAILADSWRTLSYYLCEETKWLITNEWVIISVLVVTLKGSQDLSHPLVHLLLWSPHHF